MKAVAISALAVTANAAGGKDYKAMWEQFKVDYRKVYLGDGPHGESVEDQRFKIFTANVDIIEEHNAKKLSYTLGLNEFADMTSDEFFESRLGYMPAEKPFVNFRSLPFPNITATADAVDWVAKGAVTPVKNQASCGSCWAFSTTGSVEGAYFVASGKLVSLSEENLVQCDRVSDNGCQGGLMDNAYSWIKANGICSEADYPYTSGSGVRGTCKTPKCSPVVIVTGHTDVPSNDEDALKAAVSKQPVSVAIEADKSAFQLYKGGVLDNDACGQKLDHGVLIVGYGTDGKDYWKVKNSWGPTWGEQGYIRMVRNKNQCGIATQPCYPTGAKAANPLPPSPPSPPAPPSPPSPAPAGKHYEDPKDGCSSDEVPLRIQGVSGSMCSPACSGTTCPTDVPSGVTASPTCALKDASTGKQYCALICSPGSEDAQCGSGASCKSIQGTGICTYDDDGPSPSPGPSPPPADCVSETKDACQAKANQGCHWCTLDPSFGLCLPEDLQCPKAKVETATAVLV